MYSGSNPNMNQPILPISNLNPNNLILNYQIDFHK